MNANSGETTRMVPVPGKSLENPKRSKPATSADVELARPLDDLLRRIPSALAATSTGPLPLLDALRRHDAAHQSDLSRPLLFIAAATHRTADERRTAEYLLRSRADVVTFRRSPLRLLASARCAAEMDVRRVRMHEIPAGAGLTRLPMLEVAHRSDEPSVGESVIGFLHEMTGHWPPTELARSRVQDAVAVAMELAERHALKGGSQPSILGMRTGARKDARLTTHLRGEFGDDVAARSVARLLLGGDGAPIGSSLLWCAAHCADGKLVSSAVRTRWIRDLWDADASVRGSRLQRRRRAFTVLSSASVAPSIIQAP